MPQDSFRKANAVQHRQAYREAVQQALPGTQKAKRDTEGLKVLLPDSMMEGEDQVRKCDMECGAWHFHICAKAWISR